MINLEHYKYCQERGHGQGGMITGWENHTEYTCEWCGVRYYYTKPKLVEIDPPKKRGSAKQPKTNKSKGAK